MKNEYIRNVDGLGRIVLPLELRERFGIKPISSVSVTATENGILVRFASTEPHSTKRL